MKNALIRQYFKEEDLTAVSEKIRQTELTTSGEIRVSVKEKIPFLDDRKNLFERAKKEFFRLKMDHTRDKTGILIYIELMDRQFYILADSGINEKVPQQVWDGIRDEMIQYFKQGKFSEGIIFGIGEAGKILSIHFPPGKEDKNELSNQVEF